MFLLQHKSGYISRDREPGGIVIYPGIGRRGVWIYPGEGRMEGYYINPLSRKVGGRDIKYIY